MALFSGVPAAEMYQSLQQPTPSSHGLQNSRKLAVKTAGITRIYFAQANVEDFKGRQACIARHKYHNSHQCHQ